MKEHFIFVGKQAVRMVLLVFFVSLAAFVLVSVSPLDPLQANIGGFKTTAIVTMKEFVEHLYNREYKGKIIIDDTLKAAIDAYYEQYGVK